MCARVHAVAPVVSNSLWDCSPSSSSVHGISQARILERVAISYSRGPFQPRDRTCSSSLAGRFFTTEPSGKPYNIDGFTLISTLVNIFNTSPTLKQKVGEFVQEKEMFVYWEILLSMEGSVLISFNPHNSFRYWVSLFPFYMKKLRGKMT